jgi:hypothetical protein
LTVTHSPTDLTEEPRAKAIDFDDRRLIVDLYDGRTLGIPLAWYPQLRDATPVGRNDWEPVLGGLLVRWPSLDLTLLVSALLKSPGPLTAWEWPDDQTS